MFEDEEDNWPTCSIKGCDNKVNPKRVKAMNQKRGHERCLKHGEGPKTFTTAPAYNKGAIQLITHGDIEDIGK